MRRLLQEAGALSEQYAAWQNTTAVAASSASGERTSAGPAHAHDNGDPGKV
jgi:hypothetical protein